jgi:hypothetical protein
MELVWGASVVVVAAAASTSAWWFYQRRRTTNDTSPTTEYGIIPGALLQSPYADELKLAVELAIEGKKLTTV